MWLGRTIKEAWGLRPGRGKSRREKEKERERERDRQRYAKRKELIDSMSQLWSQRVLTLPFTITSLLLTHNCSSVRTGSTTVLNEA